MILFNWHNLACVSVASAHVISLILGHFYNHGTKNFVE